MSDFKNIWKIKSISAKAKRDTMVICVLSVPLYACERCMHTRKKKNGIRNAMLEENRLVKEVMFGEMEGKTIRERSRKD